MKSVTLSNQEHKDLIEMLNDTDDSRVTSIINKLQLPQPTGLREVVEKLLLVAEDAMDCCVNNGFKEYEFIGQEYKVIADVKAALANEGKEE